MIEPSQQLAILALYAEYNRTIDAGDAASWASTFLEDGVFHHPSRRFCGHSELEEFVRARVEKLAAHDVIHQRHWNDEISLSGAGDLVHGQCLLIVAGVDRDSHKPSAVAMGSYVDEIVKVGLQWRFKQRALRVF